LDIFWLVSTFQWIDLLDIALLSYLVYRALLIVHGTRALQSLAGLVFLIVLYGASQILGLTGVYWLLEKFFVYFVLAVIILFQEDIRKGLARAGQFLPHQRATEDVSTIESVIKTAFGLASRRIGAILVLERDGIGVSEDTIQTGTYLDATISTELLTAIFIPTSPLHDGAVVIRNDRIVAAQCILPMSNQNLSKIYGTRHRAGIGLSEKSNAIILIISEERGTVALAKNGEMEIMPKNNDLREQLQSLMSPADGDKS